MHFDFTVAAEVNSAEKHEAIRVMLPIWYHDMCPSGARLIAVHCKLAPVFIWSIINVNIIESYILSAIEYRIVSAAVDDKEFFTLVILNHARRSLYSWTRWSSTIIFNFINGEADSWLFLANVLEISRQHSSIGLIQGFNLPEIIHNITFFVLATKHEESLIWWFLLSPATPWRVKTNSLHHVLGSCWNIALRCWASILSLCIPNLAHLLISCVILFDSNDAPDPLLDINIE